MEGKTKGVPELEDPWNGFLEPSEKAIFQRHLKRPGFLEGACLWDLQFKDPLSFPLMLGWKQQSRKIWTWLDFWCYFRCPRTRSYLHSVRFAITCPFVCVFFAFLLKNERAAQRRCLKRVGLKSPTNRTQEKQRPWCMMNWHTGETLRCLAWKKKHLKRPGFLEGACLGDLQFKDPLSVPLNIGRDRAINKKT